MTIEGLHTKTCRAAQTVCAQQQQEQEWTVECSTCHTCCNEWKHARQHKTITVWPVWVNTIRDVHETHIHEKQVWPKHTQGKTAVPPVGQVRSCGPLPHQPTGKPTQCFRTLTYHCTSASLLFSPDGKMGSGSKETGGLLSMKERKT